MFLLVAVHVQAQKNIEPAKNTTPAKSSSPIKNDTLPKTPTTFTGRGSRIVDDSTRNIYGPMTTLWTTEEDIFYNRKNYQPVDTSINNYHRWTYTQRFVNFYHDLGNMGTAMNPVFPVLTPVIGASSGFRVYDLYYKTEEPKYYDTKSPFTRMAIVWGGDGRASTRVEFSRNINPRWNFGFDYRPILSDKQIQRRGKGDRQTISHYYDFHTSFRSKNERYLLLANYRRLRQRVRENGGIFLTSPIKFESYFAQNAQPYLAAAQTEELRKSIHLFHQYQLAKPFQIYQSATITTQKNGFSDDLSLEVNNFYDTKIINPGMDSVKSSDANYFREFQTEFGIKGNAAFLFYNFYYKVRSFENYNRALVGYDVKTKTDGLENYVGGRIAFKFDSLSELSGNAEYLLDGNYRVQAQLKTPWLNANATSVLAKPGFLPLAYRGSHDFWINNFENTFSNQASAFLNLKVSRFTFAPGFTYTNLSKFIYYKQDTTVAEGFQTVLPLQSSGVQQLLSPELNFSVRFFRHFYLRPQAIYSKIIQNDDNVLQVPQLFVNAQLAYENMIANGNLQVQIGVDAHWKSAYHTMGYDPAIQQFYVQTTYMNPSFPLVDVFFAGKMKRGRFFFKYHNLMQAFSKTGYLPTPTYRGMQNILDFGFDLLLFD